MIKEFKEFIAKGNALELAIGVILGAAFGAVVTSLVNDVLMQIIGAIVGQPSFDNVSIRWGDKLEPASKTYEAMSKAHPGVTDLYENQIFIGSFVTKIINFLIIAFVIFLVVKAVNTMRRRSEPEVAAPAGPTEIELLAEIRDQLARR
jgi:large conductance mechanosensitive channel